MTAESVGSESAEMAGTEDDQSVPSHTRSIDIPGRFVGFWFPIIVAAIAGVMLGGLFLLGATMLFLSKVWGYGIVFGVTGVVCLFLPALLVWLILRWMWRSMEEFPPEG